MGKRIEIVWVELFASPDSANAFYSWSAADAEGMPSRGGGFRAHAAFPGLKVFRPAATRYRAVPEAFGRRGRQGSVLLVMYIYFLLVSPKLCYLFTYLKLASWIAEYVIIEHIYLNTLLHLLGEIKKEFHAYLKSIS